MSGLNVSIGYFITIVVLCAVTRVLFVRTRPKWTYVVEFIAAFALAACRLEVQTISEIGQWAGGLGPDVTLTMLFLTITIHAIIMQEATGNPSVTLMGFLQKEIGIVTTVLSVAGQFAGAHLGLLLAGWYWTMELTDMHMIKNLMTTECSTSLHTTLIQGTITEAVSATAFHLVDLSVQSRSKLLRIPLLALLLTFLYYAGSKYTAAYVNPSLAYALTFTCPGYTFYEYSLVYWLGPLLGMTLAVFLYRGNIPLLFTKNLFFKKTHFRSPKGKNSERRK